MFYCFTLPVGGQCITGWKTKLSMLSGTHKGTMGVLYFKAIWYMFLLTMEPAWCLRTVVGLANIFLKTRL